MITLALLALAVLQDQGPLPVIGLLEVPQLFRGDSLRRELEVYASPDPHAQKRKITLRRELILREHAYEEESLAVLRQSGSWLEIALADGTGWIRTPGGSRFRGLEELLSNNLSYLTKDWDGKLWDDPSDPATRQFKRSTPEPPVSILATRWIDGALWIQVRILDATICETRTPRVLDSGWLPAYSPAGAPNLWFHSRGC